ncbi:AAA family ATPase [Streptomyces sp. NPDC017082]|uniref:AAA family ATPase n=1 Tax=Streptomyces sp. NPDC017082 TaxID=3364974 RepID=UPI0037B3B10A
MTALYYPQMPENSLVVLIGPAGAGKSTIARTWPASQVLSLDALREVVSDDAGDQDATGDAVAALHLLLEARMRRHLFTVVDATNVTRAAREPLVAAAKRHNMLPIAVMVATPVTVCVQRQGPRPANRTVPEAMVFKQHQDMVGSQPTLTAEGFREIVFSDDLDRRLPTGNALALVTPMAEVDRLRQHITTLTTLAERWEQMAQGAPDFGDGLFVDEATPAQTGQHERATTYRKSATDLLDVLRTGRVPHDLMTDAELDGTGNTHAAGDSDNPGLAGTDAVPARPYALPDGDRP